MTSKKIVFTCKLGRKPEVTLSPVTIKDFCLKPTEREEGFVGLSSDNSTIPRDNVGGINSGGAASKSERESLPGD